MPKSYIGSKPPSPPDQPVEEWLKWTRSDFERELSATLPTLAVIMEINKAGDLQFLFKPTFIPNAFVSNTASAIVGNIDDSHSKSSFILTDTTDLGSFYVIETYGSIPIEIFPQEPHPSKLLVDT
jgi:hypothetical protein